MNWIIYPFVYYTKLPAANALKHDRKVPEACLLSLLYKPEDFI